MSEVNRYNAIKLKTDRGNLITYTPHGPEVVMAKDYDNLTLQLEDAKVVITTLTSDWWLLNERTLELEGQRDDLELQIEGLLEVLTHTEEERESASRKASAFEDRMGELQSENGKLKDELQLSAAPALCICCGGDMLINKGEI